MFYVFGAIMVGIVSFVTAIVCSVYIVIEMVIGWLKPPNFKKRGRNQRSR